MLFISAENLTGWEDILEVGLSHWQEVTNAVGLSTETLSAFGVLQLVCSNQSLQCVY